MESWDEHDVEGMTVYRGTLSCPDSFCNTTLHHYLGTDTRGAGPGAWPCPACLGARCGKASREPAVAGGGRHPGTGELRVRAGGGLPPGGGGCPPALSP